MKMRPIHLIACLLLIAQFAFPQGFTIDSAHQQIASQGDDLYPKWSPDGSQLLFQSNDKGNFNIYVYNFFADTVFQLTDGESNERHPEWFPGTPQVVFDSDRGGVQHLYKKDLITGQESILFKRGIQSRQASFPPTNRLVYFSGYDRLTDEWAIYSYDFISDNLNDLTDLQGDCSFPVASPLGRQLLFQHSLPIFPFEQMSILNWYGNNEGQIDSLHAIDAVWGSNGLKIYFVSTRDELQGEVYSIWKDGSHLERLTDDKYKVRTPSISPDGSKIALSVLVEDRYDIFIIPLEQY